MDTKESMRLHAGRGIMAHGAGSQNTASSSREGDGKNSASVLTSSSTSEDLTRLFSRQGLSSAPTLFELCESLALRLPDSGSIRQTDSKATLKSTAKPAEVNHNGFETLADNSTGNVDQALPDSSWRQATVKRDREALLAKGGNVFGLLSKLYNRMTFDGQILDQEVAALIALSDKQLVAGDKIKLLELIHTRDDSLSHLKGERMIRHCNTILCAPPAQLPSAQKRTVMKRLFEHYYSRGVREFGSAHVNEAGFFALRDTIVSVPVGVLDLADKIAIQDCLFQVGHQSARLTSAELELDCERQMSDLRSKLHNEHVPRQLLEPGKAPLSEERVKDLRDLLLSLPEEHIDIERRRDSLLALYEDVRLSVPAIKAHAEVLLSMKNFDSEDLTGQPFRSAPPGKCKIKAYIAASFFNSCSSGLGRSDLLHLATRILENPGGEFTFEQQFYMLCALLIPQDPGKQRVEALAIRAGAVMDIVSFKIFPPSKDDLIRGIFQEIPVHDVATGMLEMSSQIMTEDERRILIVWLYWEEGRKMSRMDEVVQAASKIVLMAGDNANTRSILLNALINGARHLVGKKDVLTLPDGRKFGPFPLPVVTAEAEAVAFAGKDSKETS